MFSGQYSWKTLQNGQSYFGARPKQKQTKIEQIRF